MILQAHISGCDEVAASGGPEILTFLGPTSGAKWGWSLRGLQNADRTMRFDEAIPHQLNPGEIVVADIVHIGHHARIFTRHLQLSRLYQGDTVVGVIGHRYATDAFHAADIDPAQLHLLTNAGLIGTVKEREASMKRPTELRLRGLIVDGAGVPVNMRTRLFQARPLPMMADVPLVLVIGTGMNSGKTTVLAKTGHELAARGKSVALLKLTGSVTHRDLFEYKSTGAAFVRDFSDYGLPSTYLIPGDMLHALSQTMIADANEAGPDVILAEIADGFLQQETQKLLRHPAFSRLAVGAILSATCAPSAMALIAEVTQLGFTNLAVSGKITNSPLAIGELRSRSSVPVLDCREHAEDMANQVLTWRAAASTAPDHADDAT